MRALSSMQINRVELSELRRARKKVLGQFPRAIMIPMYTSILNNQYYSKEIQKFVSTKKDLS